MNLTHIGILFANESDNSILPLDKPADTEDRQPWSRGRRVLIEQCINSAIVAGIAALAAADFWVGLKAFGITFLIEMRKYRKI